MDGEVVLGHPCAALHAVLLQRGDDGDAGYAGADAGAGVGELLLRENNGDNETVPRDQHFLLAEHSTRILYERTQQ